MAKCSKCGRSGLSLKVDAYGLCPDCQFVEKKVAGDRLSAMEKELEHLRKFHEEYKCIPIAANEAARLVTDAKAEAAKLRQEAADEISEARRKFDAEMQRMLKEVDSYKSSAELDIAAKQAKANAKLKKLKTDTDTVVSQTKEQLAALFAIAAKDFSFAAKSGVASAYAADQKAIRKQAAQGASISTASAANAAFTSLTPAAFKRAAARGYVVFDLETTGLSRTTDKIIEIGAIKFDGSHREIERFNTLVNPERSIPAAASAVNHITDDMVADAPLIFEESVLPRLIEFIGDLPVVAHNAEFDISFLRAAVADKFIAHISYGDSLAMCKKAYSLPNYRLESVASWLGFTEAQSHRSLGDCEMLAFVMKDLLLRL